MQSTTRLTCVLLVSGILSSTGGCGPPADLEILCGNSFRAPMEELVKRYEKETGKRVEFSFGGSETLLPQVELKATGDVFVTHSPYMQFTEDADALLREVKVGFLAPVLVVRKGYPEKLERFEDLAKEKLRVVLPDPTHSTCGKMVFNLLKKRGIKEDVLRNVGTHLVRHHSQVGDQLKLDVRDAGIMWNGVARDYRDAVDIVEMPYEYDETVRVSVMGLSYSKRQETLKEFLDFVEKHGKKVFAEFGYVKEVIRD